MKINPISVTELNRYVKEKVADDEFLTLSAISLIICCFWSRIF